MISTDMTSVGKEYKIGLAIHFQDKNLRHRNNLDWIPPPASSLLQSPLLAYTLQQLVDLQGAGQLPKLISHIHLLVTSENFTLIYSRKVKPTYLQEV